MHIFSKEEFESFNPEERGFAVYMLGCREDQPNIPNEKNPYSGKDRELYNQGQNKAVLFAQDCED